jgi:hypothetical protein
LEIFFVNNLFGQNCQPVTGVQIDPEPICMHTSTTLKALGGEANGSLSWWDAPVGGHLLSIGRSWYIPSLGGTTTYYVIQTSSQTQAHADTFYYSGFEQFWSVPAGVSTVHIKAWGAQGGNGGMIQSGGANGGFAQGDLLVIPGQVLGIQVGQKGGIGTSVKSGYGGYNGGGAGGGYLDDSGFYAGGGGGASDVRINVYQLDDRILVAGGGGGAGSGNVGVPGGAGGGAYGLGGIGTMGGSGGTQGSVGVGGLGLENGMNGDGDVGGSGAVSNNGVAGGGGGGGYWGGGGGASNNTGGGGGGGGSAFTGFVANGITTSNIHNGDGLVVLSYQAVCNYDPVEVVVPVLNLPVKFMIGGGGGFCTQVQPGAEISLSGSETGVNYQLFCNQIAVGSPLVGSGTSLSFGPQAVHGTYTIVGKNVTTGCTQTMDGTVSVYSFTCNIANTIACACKNNASATQAGQFDATITVYSSVDQYWVVNQASGLYVQDSTQAVATVPISAGLPLLPVGNGQFVLQAVHESGKGFHLTVSNGAGAYLQIGDTCQYPQINFPASLFHPYCLYSDSVLLSIKSNDNQIITGDFSINGVPNAVFHPGAGVGSYQVQYTVNGGTPKQFGLGDPGCIQTVSTVIDVVATPVQMECNDVVNISLDTICSVELTPGLILKGAFLCEDDYQISLQNQNGNAINGHVISSIYTGQTLKATIKHLVSGNTCNTFIKVEDYQAPSLSCKDLIVPCNLPSLDPVYLSSVLFLEGAIPQVMDCNSTILEHFDMEQLIACSDTIDGILDINKVVNRRWKVKDVWNNSTSCLQHIYIRRIHAADLTFPADTTLACAADLDLSPNTAGLPTYLFQGNPIPLSPGDIGCSVHLTYQDIRFPLCDKTVGILRKWTSIDDCPFAGSIMGGNDLYEYRQYVKTIDSFGPQISCPQTIRVSTDPFNCCASTQIPEVTAFDECSTFQKMEVNIQTFDAYTGNLQAELHMDGQITVQANGTIKGSYGTTPCLKVGKHTVTYVAWDACGNKGTCSMQLYVDDCIPPVAVCDQKTVVNIALDDPSDCYTPSALYPCKSTGVAWLKAIAFDDGSYDNCSSLRFTAKRTDANSACLNSLNTCERSIAKAELDSIKFYACEVGSTQTIILRVYQVDYAGACNGEVLFNECYVQVEVRDKLRPICLAPPDVTIDCTNFDPTLETYGKVTAVDNACLDQGKGNANECGVEHIMDLTLFDTICKTGIIKRGFNVFDCSGNTSHCEQRIYVNRVNHWAIHFPADLVLSNCAPDENYGQPLLLLEGCEQIGVRYQDQIIPSDKIGCFGIARTWQVSNNCLLNAQNPLVSIPNIPDSLALISGPVVSAPGTAFPWSATQAFVSPTDLWTTDYSSFWSENVPGYQYRQLIHIKDQTAPQLIDSLNPLVRIADLSSNDPLLWQGQMWWDTRTALHDLSEAQVDLVVTATDNCAGLPVNIQYLLLLDLDQDSVLETVIDSRKSGLNGLGWNKIPYGNAQNQGYSGGEIRPFDQRSVALDQQYGFAIETQFNGHKTTAFVRWNTQAAPDQYFIPALPAGKHQIIWSLEDACGNKIQKTQTILIQDKLSPVIICKILSKVDITQEQFVKLNATDLIAFSADNYTPSTILTRAISKDNSLTDMPLDINGDPQSSIVFSCAELGTHQVKLWAKDLDGNTQSCVAQVLVNDNKNYCQDSTKAIVAGNIVTENAKPVEQVTVQLVVQANGVPLLNATAFTLASGDYQLDALPIQTDIELIPSLNQNPLNGLSTYDLLLINKHILALQPFVSPYQLIAADANHSNSVTTFDIVELRRLILGLYQDFPNNTSWRFVPRQHAFPMLNNPFKEIFPESISITPFLKDTLHADFVAIKIGDVNGNVVTAAQPKAATRSDKKVRLQAQNQAIKAGEIYSIHFSTDLSVETIQFTLELNGIEMLDLLIDEGATQDQFAVFSNAVTVAYHHDPGGQNLTRLGFTLQFRAKVNGYLSDLLDLSGRITAQEAYCYEGEDLIRFEPALSFTEDPNRAFELFQNIPNPFSGDTRIRFYLPVASKATLTVFDAMGRTILTLQDVFGVGLQSFEVHIPSLEQTGLLYYRLETPYAAAYRKMLRV